MVFDINVFPWNSMCITFDEINGIIIVYDAIRYLVLFGPGRYGAIYNWIGHPSQKKWHLCKNQNWFLRLFILNLTLCNVTIFIKSVLDKDKNHYYYNTILEKTMIYYDRIDVLENINFNKGKEHGICHYCYFSIKA